MAKTYITDAMRSVIGKEYNEQISFPIGANDIRRWAIATYYPEEPPRVFWDDEYAATTKYGTIVAPGVVEAVDAAARYSDLLTTR